MGRLTVERTLIMIMMVYVCVLYKFGQQWTEHKTGQAAGVRARERPSIVWLSPSIRVSAAALHCGHAQACKVFTEVDNYLFRSSSLNRAYIFTYFNPRHVYVPKASDKVIWGLFYHESVKYSAVFHDNKFYNMFNYSATFSVRSDVPYPLTFINSLNHVTSTAHFVGTALKNSYLISILPVMYLQSECTDFTERDQYVVELMKYIPVDSYGACENNNMLPPALRQRNRNHVGLVKFTSKYKFVLAIENSVCEDYFTEKIWRPIEAGAVPIYFGATSIRCWLPNERSAILIEHYPTPKLLSEYLYKLLANDSLYDEYLEHKTGGIVTNTRLRYELMIRPYQNEQHHTERSTAATFECFICCRLHELSGGRPVKVSKVQRSHHFCQQPKSVFQTNFIRDPLKFGWVNRTM